MRKNGIGAALLVGVLIAAGLLLSSVGEKVLGQPGTLGQSGMLGQTSTLGRGEGFSAPAPQVLMNLPAELPKCCVDFVTLPPAPGESVPRFRVITVVDTEAKKIAVYHMEMVTGKLWFRSVRDIKPDLMINQFNASSPTPSEIMGEMERFKEK